MRELGPAMKREGDGSGEWSTKILMFAQCTFNRCINLLIVNCSLYMTLRGGFHVFLFESKFRPWACIMEPTNSIWVIHEGLYHMTE